MKHKHSLSISLSMIAVLITTLACGLSNSGGDSGSSDTIKQWASTAYASSEFMSSEWSAGQATGKPNTTTCGDQTTAWASASSVGQDWLDAGFSTPVVPTQINIHESYTPGSIVKVEVRDTDGSYHTVYEGEPTAVSQCPRVLQITITDIDFKITSVLISVDQSILGDWDEIDAVELIGTP